VIRLSLVLFGLLSLLGCSAAPEAKYAVYLSEGKEFAAKKDYPRAVLQFKNASKLMPKNAEPYYQLGLAATAMGETAAGAEFFNRAVALNPKHADAMIALADLFTRAVQPSSIEEGKRYAQRALALVPGNLKALNLIALADLRTGNSKAAAAQLEDLSRRFPGDVETAVNLARVRLTMNDERGAEDLLRSTAARAPQDSTALFALADFYAIRGDPPRAVEWYQRGLRIQPDNGQALAALGRLQAGAGRNAEADAAFARLSRSQDPRFRYAYAMRLEESGRRDAAAAEFARIFKERPEDREARTHLFDAWLDAGRVGDAETLLAEALATDPRDTDAMAQQARVYLSQGKVDAAEKNLNAVLQYRPDSAPVHYLIAQVHRSRENEQLQILELSEALRLDPRYLPARIDLSRSLIRSDPQRALSVIDSTPEDQRQNLALRIQRIWPLIELKRPEEVRPEIDALLGTGNPEVQLQDAVLRMRQKDFSAAMASAQKALQANPSDIRALDIVMRCAVGEKAAARGLEIIRSHAARNPKLLAVQMFLARLEFRAGNAAQARAAFEAAKTAAPNRLDGEWGLVELDIAERKLDDARHRLAPLMHGSNEAMAAAKLALVEQVAGNYEAACRHYRRVLEIKPSDAGVLNNLAYILTEFLGNQSEALRYARTAKELVPGNAAIDDTLGWTYYHMGQYGEAIRHLEAAVKGAPSARHNAHLAMAYAQYGDRARARETLSAALKMDPKLPEAVLAREIVARKPASSQNR
jgi:tetratricopeptide (TPR) repeat protein